jgi:hypothetical protein
VVRVTEEVIMTEMLLILTSRLAAGNRAGCRLER